MHMHIYICVYVEIYGVLGVEVLGFRDLSGLEAP